MSDTTTLLTPVIRTPIANLATFLTNNLGAGPVSYDTLYALIQTYQETVGNSPIPLSNVSVDYETNLAEISNQLSTSTGTNGPWMDKTTAGTGQTLTRMISTAMTYNQVAIVRAAQEAMIPTAIIDSSIFAATLHLGVRLVRKIPAQIPVTLNYAGDTSSSFSLSPYTQFSVGGVFLFNRDTIIFPAGTSSVNWTLYEGQVQQAIYTSTGAAYQSYEIGNSDYTISDIDTTVTVNNIAWTRTETFQFFNIGLWEAGPNDLVFEDEGTADGNAEINFGNNIFGAIPTPGGNIIIGYVITNGQSGNVDLTGSSISCTNNTLVTGSVTGVGVNGVDELSATDYQTLSPGLFFANYRAISLKDHPAVARRYPGVIDAYFEGQQQINPSDLRYMMVSRITLLTNSVWSDTDWSNFTTWLTNLDIAQMQYIQQTAVAVPITVEYNVYCTGAAASLASVQNKIIANIQAAFVLRAGILGYSRPASDLNTIVENSDSSIDWYDLVSPSGDTNVTIPQYITLAVTPIINMMYSTRNTLN